MTPREIHYQFPPNPADLYIGEDSDDMYDRKLEEAESTGMAAHIRQHGVVDPIHLQHGTPGRFGSENTYVRNGMHRLAAAGDAAPDKLVPVWHSDADNYTVPPFRRDLPGYHFS